MNKTTQQIIISAALLLIAASPAVAAKLIRATEPAPAASAPAPVAPTVTTAPAKIMLAAAPQAAAPAQPAQAYTPPASPNLGTYIGLQLGDSTVGGLLGYQFSKMWAMEINYDYVDPKYTPTTTIEKNSAGISGLALFPIKFNEMGPMAIYIKVGYGRTTDKLTVEDPGLGTPAFPATTTVTTTITTGVTAC